MKKLDGKYKRADIFWGYLMIGPTILGLLILNIIPFFYSIYLSFCQTGDFGNTSFSGMDNYAKFVTDPVAWSSTRNTLVYVLLTVPLGVMLALGLAALLNSKIRGKDTYRAIYFLPIVCAPAAIAMVWRWMFHGEYGLINQILSVFGVSNIPWLTEPAVAMVAVSIVTIWSSIGYDIILILAGLQGISQSYYEAGKIDGATGLQQFFRITVPLVSPTMFFVLIMRIMSALKQFDLIYMLVDEKNPALSGAQTLTYLFYRQAFVIKDKGYASVIVLWTFFIIALITIVQFSTQKKWVHYD